MSDPDLRIGTFRYDTTQPLLDGETKPQGFTAEFSSAATIPEIFGRMLRDREYDVSELGWTFYLRTLELDEPPFLALPIFPNHVFRHSAIFVNVDSGIDEPGDLAGKTIGEFGTYGQDSGVWAKGLLSDEYGYSPGQSRWVIGGLNAPMKPFDFTDLLHPAGVDVTEAQADKSLSELLETGEIDALISANTPQCFLDDSPRVRRLFPDSEPLARDYYRRTGIFPMMHLVVIRRDVVARNPELTRAVYECFLDAKNAAMAKYENARRTFQVQTMPPFVFELFEKNRRLFGDDWYPYGVAKNRNAIEAFHRYHYEQGLSTRHLSIEDVFAPDLLDT
ncbi:4,5-dihydroxyphthalate decarboxylase [Amycolatopsis sp. NBC_00345]|uniref:4,5-dihydroxyphthalate decarboxylase n=1 Tax=Amycolatopsis sp. NBC_00345 TaxID=2975955 RepID=UPI002E26AC1F